MTPYTQSSFRISLAPTATTIILQKLLQHIFSGGVRSITSTRCLFLYLPATDSAAFFKPVKFHATLSRVKSLYLRSLSLLLTLSINHNLTSFIIAPLNPMLRSAQHDVKPSSSRKLAPTLVMTVLLKFITTHRRFLYRHNIKTLHPRQFEIIKRNIPWPKIDSKPLFSCSPSSPAPLSQETNSILPFLHIKLLISYRFTMLRWNFLHADEFLPNFRAIFSYHPNWLYDIELSYVSSPLLPTALSVPGAPCPPILRIWGQPLTIYIQVHRQAVYCAHARQSDLRSPYRQSQSYTPSSRLFEPTNRPQSKLETK